MKLKNITTAVLVIVFLFFLNGSLKAQNKIWVSAYYAGWMQGQNDDGYLTSSEIDYSAVTQIIQFSLLPNSDGSIDASSNSITQENSSRLISSAHAKGVKVIICIGGWGSENNFLGATSPFNLSNFVSNIVDFVKSRGYDGVDIDWETLSLSDILQYTTFITALRTALNNISPRPILTAATAWQPALFATLSGMFDEINLMSYDFSGAWPGWVTWFNSPIYNSGITFPSTGVLVPSINNMVNLFIAAGVPADKLGIGIDFYGYVWSGGSGTSTGGVTKPNQTWTVTPKVQANVPYSTIMKQYYNSNYYRWDTTADASFLSIDNPGSTNDKFISYDDQATCTNKVDYVKTNGLGGVIIWELGGGFQSYMPTGQQDLLLQSVKAAVNGTPINISHDSSDLLIYNGNLNPSWNNSSWNAVTNFTYSNIKYVNQNSLNIIQNPNGALGLISGISAKPIEVNSANYNSLQFAIYGEGSNLDIAVYLMTSSNGYFPKINYGNVSANNWTNISIPLNVLDPNNLQFDKIIIEDISGNRVIYDIGNLIFKSALITADQSSSEYPNKIILDQNYPNPFNPSTVIQYEIPSDGFITLKIYDELGKEVETIVNRYESKGKYSIDFNAEFGSSLSSGIYFYQLRTLTSSGKSYILTKKMMLLK